MKIPIDAPSAVKPMALPTKGSVNKARTLSSTIPPKSPPMAPPRAGFQASFPLVMAKAAPINSAKYGPTDRSAQYLLLLKREINPLR